MAPPVEEWGGIAYALGGLDASLSPAWEIVPLIKAAVEHKGVAFIDVPVGCSLAPHDGGRRGDEDIEEEEEDLADGAVVNILDQKVANLNPDFFSYSCGKVALTGATAMLAQALAPRIRVNAISPGLSLPSLDQSDEEFGAVASQNLLRRPMDVRAIADAVAFLLTARGVRGQNIFVDNGQRFLTRDSDVMFDTRRGKEEHHD